MEITSVASSYIEAQNVGSEMSQNRRRRTLGKVGRYAVDATPPLPEESPEEPARTPPYKYARPKQHSAREPSAGDPSPDQALDDAL